MILEPYTLKKMYVLIITKHEKSIYPGGDYNQTIKKTQPFISSKIIICEISFANSICASILRGGTTFIDHHNKRLYLHINTLQIDCMAIIILFTIANHLYNTWP